MLNFASRDRPAAFIRVSVAILDDVVDDVVVGSAAPVEDRDLAIEDRQESRQIGVILPQGIDRRHGPSPLAPRCLVPGTVADRRRRGIYLAQPPAAGAPGPSGWP